MFLTYERINPHVLIFLISDSLLEVVLEMARIYQDLSWYVCQIEDERWMKVLCPGTCPLSVGQLGGGWL